MSGEWITLSAFQHTIHKKKIHPHTLDKSSYIIETFCWFSWLDIVDFIALCWTNCLEHSRKVSIALRCEHKHKFPIQFRFFRPTNYPCICWVSIWFFEHQLHSKTSLYFFIQLIFEFLLESRWIRKILRREIAGTIARLIRCNASIAISTWLRTITIFFCEIFCVCAFFSRLGSFVSFDLYCVCWFSPSFMRIRCVHAFFHFFSLPLSFFF